MEEEVHLLGATLLQVLEVRNAIDVMHLTKNLCVNLLGFMGVYGKPKDSLEARQDLKPKVTIDKEYGMTTVDLNNIGYKDEPFVLAADVSQMFYVKDMSTKSKRGKNEDINSMINEPKHHIVLSGKINIVGIEDKSDMSENYERNVRIPPFIVKKDPSIMLNDEDTPWLRQDHN